MTSPLPRTLRIGIFIFEDFEPIDVWGFAEAFTIARFLGESYSNPERKPFEVCLIAKELGAVRGANGPRALPDYDLAQARQLPFDVLMMPGGGGTHPLLMDEDVLEFLRFMDSRVGIMASVCTGAAMLAKAGLLQGKPATTNQDSFNWISRLTPDVLWNSVSRWVDAGHYVTSAGVSAGVDMAFYLVSRLAGRAIAETAVRDAEYDWHRNPEQPIDYPPQALVSRSDSRWSTPPMKRASSVTPPRSWAGLTGKVVRPEDLSYDSDRIDYNTRKLYAPTALVFCQNAGDVQNAVNCVREQNIPFRVRSGGHSYEEFSLMNDGLIIDISGLTATTLTGSTARVGAGLSQQDMWKLLGKTPSYAFPLGTMGGVGIAGVLQGGGIGMLTREFGLALDRITSIQLVTAAGDLVEANAKDHAELFWALRGGGGGNFGIVTAFSLDLVTLPTVAVYALSWPKEQFRSVMDYWQRWAPTVPDTRLTCQLTFSSDGSLHSEGVYLGAVDTLTQLLKPWMDRCPPSSRLRAAQMSWYESTTYFNSFDNQCPHPFKTTGAFVSAPLPPDALATIEQAINNAPANVSCDIWMQSFGGVMATSPSGDTAFAHRDAQFILEFGGSWLDPAHTLTGESAARWARELRLSLAANTRGAYVNFADLELGSRTLGNLDYLAHYYGGNADRLRALKAVWDPGNLFRFEQSIPLPGNTPG